MWVALTTSRCDSTLADESYQIIAREMRNCQRLGIPTLCIQ